MLDTNYLSIEYQAQTKLMDLAELIADTRKREKRDRLLDQAATIRYYLKAVELKTTYLEDSQVNNIYQCLIETSGINDYPTVPIINPASTPNIGTTIIVQGTPGERGADGGGTDFEQVNVTTDTVVDTFNVTDSVGARWDVVIYDGVNQRQETLSTTWLADGSTVATPVDISSNDIGDTSPVTLSIEYFSGAIRLIASVTSGTWTISGSRYFIPNSGAFQGVSGTSGLADGKIFIGNSSNIATAQTVSGDISITNAGVTSISSGVIVNADINSSAGISVSKLAALTASRAVASDASGFLTTTSVTSTELGYLSGVTSSLQTQLDSKLSATTGAISTVVSSNLTIDRAVISNGSGKIAVSSVTSTELGYVSGVTSAIQTQLNSKVNSLTDTFYVKTISIGDWNMVANQTVSVLHGVDYTKIRQIYVLIRPDDDASFPERYTPISGNSSSTSIQGNYRLNNSTDILISRVTGGWFDDTRYDKTSFNRGWVTITYVA